ncbi:autorepressor SdpR family transcription factor [Brytella acorum]|uniref:Autorepressor SdpR family transcription factor n=1 Tax=Brytella acorum TaxID=2959299 RepID=A0AA35VB89_9PROT|nr:autorepressor SdpR family transcription factor [Brytella acorum]MDF3625012.1 autorepressor SdpR family transcription factor [Brytella acorum]CAI9121110.1 autorepressor SdpR family transcription factor [Brytella acorum]
MSDVFKALADPTRRAILVLLRERAMTAGEIAEHFNLTRSTLSGHFSTLHAAGLVERDREGTTITYRLRLSVLEEAWLGLASALHLGEETTRWKKNDV